MSEQKTQYSIRIKLKQGFCYWLQKRSGNNKIKNNKNPDIFCPGGFKKIYFTIE